MLVEVKANAEAAFSEFLGEDADSIKVGDSKQKESFDVSMVDADVIAKDAKGVKAEKIEKEEDFERSLADFEVSTLDALGDKAGDASTTRYKNVQAPATVTSGFKNEDIGSASRVKIQSPPYTLVTKRKRKSSEVGDIETDAQARDREPDADKADDKMEDADGGKVGEAVVRSQAREEVLDARRDNPKEGTEVAELGKV